MSNIVLTGMPGAGKSTIGPVLASKLGMKFADLDDIIKVQQGMELKDIVQEHGYEYFLKIQEKVILSLRLENHVLATGGSVVKSPASMEHLKKNGRVVYLKVDFKTLEARLSPDRRLARGRGQSFRDIFEEREPLYVKYADITLDCDGKSVETIAVEILAKIK